MIIIVVIEDITEDIIDATNFSERRFWYWLGQNEPIGCFNDFFINF